MQRLIAELNKEQEAFIASKQTEKGEAVAPWVGAPNEDALREECLSLSTVSKTHSFRSSIARRKTLVVVIVGKSSDDFSRRLMVVERVVHDGLSNLHTHVFTRTTDSIKRFLFRDESDITRSFARRSRARRKTLVAVIVGKRRFFFRDESDITCAVPSAATRRCD